jgi:hypothetical protein
LHDKRIAIALTVMHDIRVSVVSAEEEALGVAEFRSGDRMIGFTRIETVISRRGSSPAPTAWCSARTPWPKPSRRPTASSLSTEHTKRKGMR